MSRQENRNRVKALLLKGKTPSAVAAEVGVNVSTVYRVRDRMGVRKGNRAAYRVVSARVTDNELAILERLVRGGVAQTPAAVTRKLVRAAGAYFETSAEEEAFLRGALKHIEKLGGNFNQLAAALSISVKKTGDPNPYANQEELMRTALDEVHKITGVLKAMLRNQQERSGTLVQRLSDDDFGDHDDG